MRGVQIRGGFHDFVIRPGGVTVFPRLVSADHATLDSGPVITSETGLDTLLRGGLARGTTTLLMGPSGTGKSSIALAYLYRALASGEPGYLAVFDETRRISVERAAGLGMPLDGFVKDGLLKIDQIDPAELSPGELASRIQQAVEQHGAKVVIIDSLTGYLNAMPEEQYLVLQMHEISTYLNQKGVTTILILANHGLVGQMTVSVDLTYLSDTVILLRYFEAFGRIRRAVSVVKKRVGAHEDAIREFTLSAKGLTVGEALTDFSGVLTGVPTYHGSKSKLMSKAPPVAE